MRKSHEVFGRGSLEFVPCPTTGSWPTAAQYGDQTVLVVNNLSRFAQPAELDLRELRRGDTRRDHRQSRRFRASASLPYFVTLSPHSFFWFRLDRDDAIRRR